MRVDRKIKLAVIQHLGPDIVVDDASDVLEKLAVDVFRDRSAGFGGVDRGMDWMGLSGTIGL